MWMTAAKWYLHGTIVLINVAKCLSFNLDSYLRNRDLEKRDLLVMIETIDHPCHQARE